MKSVVPIDLHVHSDFSCCPVTMQEAVWEAKLSGLKTIGFSDHYDKILDNSSFEKYCRALNTVSQSKILNVKKGIEFEINNLDQLLKDLDSKQCSFDYILYHNLETADDLTLANEISKKMPTKLIVAHPNIGYWETPNDKIIEIVKQNNLIIEINKIHLELMKKKPLEKEKDFYKKVLKEKNIQVSFGTDYHSYGEFTKNNTLYSKLFSKIEKQRIFLHDSINSKTYNVLPDIRTWQKAIDIKKIAKEIQFDKKDTLKNYPLEKEKTILIENSNKKNSKQQTENILEKISEQNNTGLNLFLFELLQKNSEKNSALDKSVMEKIQTEFINSNKKDIRRYSYKTLDILAKKSKPNTKQALSLLKLALFFEKSNALIKNISKYLKESEGN